METIETTIATRQEVAIHTNGVDLLAMLETVLPAVPKRSTIPILESVMIYTDEEGRIGMTGTDLELAIQTGRIPGAFPWGEV